MAPRAHGAITMPTGAVVSLQSRRVTPRGPSLHWGEQHGPLEGGAGILPCALGSTASPSGMFVASMSVLELERERNS